MIAVESRVKQLRAESCAFVAGTQDKDWFDITPAVFYSKNDHLLTTVYDPRVNLSYQQYIEKATG